MRPLLLFAALSAVQAQQLVDVRKIWDEAPHNAFTDLVHHRGEWFCVFREGKAHVSPDGKLRVIVSKDGVKWESAALISSPLGDLRDAKITVTPRGELMLNGAVAVPQPADKRHQSFAWFSKDGRTWGEAVPVGDADFWLWRVTWWKKQAYGIGYSTNPDRNLRTIRLYQSKDGRRYETLVTDLGVKQSPGETAIRFQKDGTALCLLRRDPYRGDPPISDSAATAVLGRAKPPYKEWTWRDLGVRIGGPNFIELPDGRYVAVVRLHDGKTRTSLCWLDPAAGTLKEFLPLPSDGDSSYAGLVWREGLLWISYYSSHEGKTSIYLAKVRFS